MSDTTTAIGRGDAGTDSSHRHVVVVGAGPAAHRLTESLHARAEAATSGSERLRITVIGEEPWLPYDRVALSTRLAAPVDLTLGDRTLWAHEDVVCEGGVRVERIDPTARTVSLSDGRQLQYDDLVLATGSSATVPPIPGAHAGRVYRTIEDVDRLRAEVLDHRERHGRPAAVVVVGGGLLGLEAAGGALALGATSSIIHSGKWLMSAQLDEGAGQALGRVIHAKGIHTHLGTRPAEVLTAPSGRVIGVALEDGTTVPADIVVFSIGITPRDELARAAGITTAPRGGILTGADCATSAPGVWAIGEVASVEGGGCVGLVAPANAMAEVVADRLSGGTAEFPGIDDATKLKLAGVDVASFGDAFARTPGALEVVYADRHAACTRSSSSARTPRRCSGVSSSATQPPTRPCAPCLGESCRQSRLRSCRRPAPNRPLGPSFPTTRRSAPATQSPPATSADGSAASTATRAPTSER